MAGPPTVTVDDADAVDRAEAALRAGEAIVIPTDTVYGLAVRPGREDLLAELKDRPADMPIAVLIAAPDAVDLPPLAARLATAFWPGPLTLVVPAPGGGTIGLRCPDDGFVRSLAGRIGPMPTTSANRHGRPTPSTAAEAAASLARSPALVVDGGRREGVASTVVDCTGDCPRVLREGALPEGSIVAALS